jgi:carotenoid 1,2-hydratase
VPLTTTDAAKQQGGRWDEFDAPIPNDGYRWWYVDALSDDGRTGITLIAMLGSVFSPYYARQRRLGPSDPLEHCALNVALYGRPVKRWALTERTRADVERAADGLRIGSSTLQWSGERLHFDIDERSAVFGRSMVGEVIVTPLMQTERVVTLNPDGAHHWCPIAPRCDVQVRFRQPELSWHGTGYLDSNFGSAPLERGFQGWNWSRAALSGGRTGVLYNVAHRNGERHSLAITIDAGGSVDEHEIPARTSAGKGFWGVDRDTHADQGARPRLLETLEDTPFYTRSVLDTRLFGESVRAMHESLDLDRFDARWVQSLIPFRNPRRRHQVAR